MTSKHIGNVKINHGNGVTTTIGIMMQTDTQTITGSGGKTYGMVEVTDKPVVMHVMGKNSQGQSIYVLSTPEGIVRSSCKHENYPQFAEAINSYEAKQAAIAADYDKAPGSRLRD